LSAHRLFLAITPHIQRYVEDVLERSSRVPSLYARNDVGRIVGVALTDMGEWQRHDLKNWAYMGATAASRVDVELYKVWR